MSKKGAGDALNAVEQKSKSLLRKAITVGASDIHLVPRKKDALIRFRVDEVLTNMDSLSKRFAEKIISHFKFLAGMDIGEKRRPQNGALNLSTVGHEVNLRLSTLPTPFSESLAIRILPQEQTFTLSELSLFPEASQQLLALAKKANGLVVLTGPTGSGKTTTLYSLLYAAKQLYNRSIITLEDPIEKKSDSFIQMEVNEKADVTYATGFKSILRHDPDIIMIGEIRDIETAKIAIRAAFTGHLVLSTMHTKDSVGCIHRLTELAIPLSDLQQTLTGVVAQRLVELNCPYCGQTCQPKCRTMGARRRLGIYEILTGDCLGDILEGKTNNAYKKIEDLIIKGIALGFISERNYERWVGDIREKQKVGK
jgi:competence protein ComGA